MKTVVINALNSNSGGGKSIRDSYLRLLNGKDIGEKYVVIAPKGAELSFITNPQIQIIEMPKLWSRTLFAPLVYRFGLGRIIRNLRASAVLNMGDLIIHTDAKQLYIFDWPYALDVHANVWRDMTLIDWLNRKVKLWLLKRDFGKPDIVIAQTDYIKSRLSELYELNDIRVINNAVTLNSPDVTNANSITLPHGVRLVYPTVYYPHKNLEVLIELAELIRLKDLDYRIVTTVNPVSDASRNFLDSIAERELQNIIVNIGQIPLDQMRNLYVQGDALLMPTLLESFSIVYLEAMHFKLPIFTSDMWFAHSVCDAAATYFDPFDAKDILAKVEEVMSNSLVKYTLIESGTKRLNSFPSWDENFSTYQIFIRELLGEMTKEVATIG